MPYDPRVHHRRSIRLRGWDYARPGFYFVTVCAAGKRSLFGEVLECENRLNECGRAVFSCWRELPRHYPTVRLDAFVVMPNHVHGIIEVTAAVGAGLRPAPTKSAPVSEMIRAFKAFSARRVNLLHGTTGKALWQRNYYEHIVRNPAELVAIRDYIATNPVRWDTDPENPLATSAAPEDWLPQKLPGKL